MWCSNKMRHDIVVYHTHWQLLEGHHIYSDIFMIYSVMIHNKLINNWHDSFLEWHFRMSQIRPIHEWVITDSFIIAMTQVARVIVHMTESDSFEWVMERMNGFAPWIHSTNSDNSRLPWRRWLGSLHIWMSPIHLNESWHVWTKSQHTFR